MNDSRYRNTSAINYLSLSQRSAAVVEIGLEVTDINIGNLVQGEHPNIRVEWGGGLFSAENLQYLLNGAGYDQAYY